MGFRKMNSRVWLNLAIGPAMLPILKAAVGAWLDEGRLVCASLEWHDAHCFSGRSGHTHPFFSAEFSANTSDTVGCAVSVVAPQATAEAIDSQKIAVGGNRQNWGNIGIDPKKSFAFIGRLFPLWASGPQTFNFYEHREN